MKFSLCGQYWIKDDSFETLKILSCSRRKVYTKLYESVQNVVYDYIRL